MKKNMFKRALALLCTTTAIGSTLGMAACGGGSTGGGGTSSSDFSNIGGGTYGTNLGSDTEQTLEVLVWDAGYGTKWCSDLLKAFMQEAWVQSKYPNLVVDFTADGNGTTITTKIDAGERANTVDLFFTGGIDKYLGKDAAGYEWFADLTETVYNKTVPGEAITVKDKMLDSYVESMRFYEKGQDSNMADVVPFKSYVFPWASGMDSILYNADHLNALDMEVPLTTDQFIEACALISDGKAFDYNNKPDGDYAIMRSSTGAYWAYVYPVWWAQYEGIDEYRNFFNGVSNGRISADVFRQKGKLYALTAFEQILKYENGYVYKKNAGLDFMQAQTRFLKGEGVFSANGDWFSKEMEDRAKEIKEEYDGLEYEIRMMRVPIISNIIEKTPSIPNDETLRSVIRCIDAGYTDVAAVRQDPSFQTEYEKIKNVTEKDYQYIKDARGMTHALGPNHQAGVPSYAKGKEVAYDFLSYMATDKAQEIYMKATGGASLPFEYDLEKENNALYKELFEGENKKLYAVEKDRLSYLYNQCYKTTVLPDPDSFPLVKWGGMAAIYSLGGHSIVAFFGNKGAATTARQVWEDDIKYYIDNGGFDKCRTNAGI